MVALVTSAITGKAMAVHRTWLSADGIGKARVDPPRGMIGPCRGGVVRLGEPGTELLIGEGIETCLSAAQVTGLPAWAALSTSGLQNLDLPERLRCPVAILADGDEAGESAACISAKCWARQGRRVRIARPPWGMDFNDVLLAKHLEVS
jgi:predicted nucleic acid-binding protein